MKNHTTFRVGGPAEYFITVAATEQLQATVRLCNRYEVPWVVLGNGSNVLVSDKGIRGVVLRLAGDFVQCEIKENVHSGNADAVAGGGMLLSAFAMQLAKKGFSGFEFAAGIPGSVGGAVMMNAGAYGSEIKDCILSARVMDGNGEVKELTKDELKLGYRTSAIQGTEWIVLDACFAFCTGKKEDILSEIEELNQRRRDKQPLEYPSAGSTFKRPEGYFAGKLIMDAGLAGYRVGDAEISTKHCGFAINRGNATAAEFYQLMQDVTERVKEAFGVTLEPEVRLLGEFPA